MIHRRALLRGIGALLCAPAIVRASSLMPISVLEEDWEVWIFFDGRSYADPGPFQFEVSEIADINSFSVQTGEWRGMRFLDGEAEAA